MLCWGRSNTKICMKWVFFHFPKNQLTCLSVLDVMLWHQRLGYASFFFLISWCLSESYVLRKVCMCYLVKLTLWMRMMHRMKTLNWALQGKICCLYMRKVSLPKIDHGLELFLRKVGKVWTNQGQALLNPVWNKISPTFPEQAQKQVPE